jgi:phosphoglycerate dehydrogenase-like enzyme
MAAMLKVYIPESYVPNTAPKLRELLPAGVEVTEGPESPQPADCDILVHGFVKRAWLAASPNLRAVIVPFAGVPVETYELLGEFPQISLHNLHFNDAPTAEFAIALLMAAAKFLIPSDRKLRLGDWHDRYEATPTEILAGKTALILGYGAIGRRIAPVCQALGMAVVGVRRHEPANPEERGVAVYSVRHLHELLPQADALLCVLPETPETTGLIGAAELDLLPRHAIVVNVGRGPVIDEAALYHALAQRHIKAAGIDVWYNYPHGKEARSHTLPSVFPFHELDNVVMSPHRAGWLSAAEEERLAALAELLRFAAAGRPMPNLVDKALGY